MHRAARMPAAIVLALLSSCGAAYPRYTTAMRPVPEGMATGGEITPPPDDVQRIAAVRAEVPRQTRDARAWDNDPGPDPYVIVYRNGSEILRTHPVSNTFRPEWNANVDHVDARIAPADVLRIELRDDDGITSELVGATEVRGVPSEARGGGVWTLRLEGGATVEMQATPPPPQLGLGITYEFHGDDVRIVSLEGAGPAYGAGLRPGDRITAINGHPVHGMSELEAREAMDRGSMADVTFTVAHEHGAPSDVAVRRDAVYPAR